MIIFGVVSVVLLALAMRADRHDTRRDARGFAVIELLVVGASTMIALGILISIATMLVQIYF